MFFPEQKRVIYKKNPLQEVVCQLRFPKILRLESTESKPYDLQEVISNTHPNFVETQTIDIQVKEAGGQFTTMHTSKPVYEFYAADELSKVVVTSESISLSVRKYTKWEDFLSPLSAAIAVFEKLYGPQSYNRIGLRYVNVIRPSAVGVSVDKISTLLNPSIGGAICDNGLSSSIKQIRGEFLMSDEENGMTARYSTLFVEDEKGGTEEAFLLDSDFYTIENIENIGGFNDNLGRIRNYKNDAHNFFRWAISSDLHDRMEPENLSA